MIDHIEYARKRSAQAVRSPGKSKCAEDRAMLLKEVDRLNRIINQVASTWIVVQVTDDDLVCKKFDNADEAHEFVGKKFWPYVMIEASDGYFKVEESL